MKKSGISRWQKGLLICFILFVLLCLIGRNSYPLGIMLILGRWLFVFLGALFLFLFRHQQLPRIMRLGLYLTLFLLIGEVGWNRWNSYHLSSPESPKEVSLMTYNLFFRNKAPEMSFALIEEKNPDILLVQELTAELETGLDKQFGKKYPYKKTKAMRGTHGIGIYSIYPIESSVYLEYRENRPFCQVLVLTIHGKRVRLFNSHLASPGAAVEHPENFYSLFGDSYHLREKQIATIHGLLDDTGYEAEIFSGDLNTTKYEPLYRQLKDYWCNPVETYSIGSAKNFPNSTKSNPLITLDYILLRGAVGAQETAVIPGGSSDHMAVIGKLTF